MNNPTLIHLKLFVFTGLFVFLNGVVIPAQTPAIEYKLYRNAFVDSIFFPAADPEHPKKISVRDLNPYNYLKDLHVVDQTAEGNNNYVRKPRQGGVVSVEMPVGDTCKIDSLCSYTHVFTDGKIHACITYVLTGWKGSAIADQYSSFIILDQAGNIKHKILHEKGAAIAPCVDDDGQFLTYAYSIVQSCRVGQNIGGCRIYDLRAKELVYDAVTDNDWSNIYLTDGYIALMTLPEEQHKRYRLFDLKAKLFYDAKVP